MVEVDLNVGAGPQWRHGAAPEGIVPTDAFRPWNPPDKKATIWISSIAPLFRPLRPRGRWVSISQAGDGRP
jgi:hypothetical protein